MSSADKMRRLFDEAAVQTNAAPDNAVFEEIKTTYTRAVQHKSAQQKPNMWRSIMKSPSAKLAVAAAVVIACVIGLSLWRTTGSGVALADVLARIEQVKAFQCKATQRLIHEVPGGKPRTREMHQDYLVSKEYGGIIRFEQLDPNGERVALTDLYFSPATNVMVMLAHTQKRYIRAELDSFLGQQIRKDLDRHRDPVALLKEITACKHESIGRSTVDGIEAEGFHTSDPNCGPTLQNGLNDPQTDVKVWIDVKTRLPVRYESVTRGLDEKGDRARCEHITYNFQWDVQVDASELEPPTVPDGYTVPTERPWQSINEQAATGGLRQCAELFGKYPESLLIGSSSDPTSDLEGKLNKSDTRGAIRLKEELQGLAEQEKAKRLADARLVMVRLFLFYMNLTNEKKDPAYYGSTVAPKDADKVLLRWKLSDTEYRVIFGDLHGETVSPEKLAELERALPK
ncbi:MAG: hypothetical protein KBE65_22015 [Phycisphaerae bacterium]|nr:hypothetical protein [Phycisphaerae bacterium]